MTRSQRFFLVIAATWLGAGLLQAAAGPTASSYLRFLEVERNGSGSITGLDGASGVAVSPDGRTVYATGEVDDALAVFHRDSATGALTFVEMKQDAVDGVDGLNGAHGVVVSPDGVHVYVASKTGDALAVFSRDVDTGALTFVQAKNDGVGKVNGLDGAEGIAISPDGAHVYVAGRNDDSLAVFSRDAATGALTYVEIQRDGYAGVVQGLLGAKAVAVSPDGAHVYAAGSLENAVAVFGRDAATGKLTFIEVQREGQNGVLGLFGAKAVTVSLDGANLYVAGGYDGALVVFDRNPETGMLTSVQLLEDGVGGVNGLNGADAVAVSPDGTHVFVTGSVDNALAVFERDPATGTLTYVERLRDGIAGVDGLHKAQAVAVSPDGASVYAAGSADTAVAVFRVRRCGDGVLDPGEQCDDGNVQDGDCCSSTCRFGPAPVTWKSAAPASATPARPTPCSPRPSSAAPQPASATWPRPAPVRAPPALPTARARRSAARRPAPVTSKSTATASATPAPPTRSSLRGRRAAPKRTRAPRRRAARVRPPNAGPRNRRWASRPSSAPSTVTSIRAPAAARPCRPTRAVCSRGPGRSSRRRRELLPPASEGSSSRRRACSREPAGRSPGPGGGSTRRSPPTARTRPRR